MKPATAIATATLGALTLFATLGLVAAQDRPAAAPAPAPAEPAPAEDAPDRPADREAIAAVLARFVAAYNDRDARALAALCLPEAEIEDEDGELTRGTADITARFERIFAEADADDRLAVTPDSLRFLGDDLAVEDGVATLTGGAEAPPLSNRYRVLYARHDGRWLHARIEDRPAGEPSAHERLEELSWLLGDWINESDEGLVSTHGAWSDDGNFLVRTFDIRIEGDVALSGTQRIGWDAQRKQFRSWVFDTDGGFAEGLLARDGDGRWVAHSTGVRSDGQSVSLTTTMTILGPDRVLWETSDRTLGGVAIPEPDAYYLVRQPPPPGP